MIVKVGSMPVGPVPTLRYGPSAGTKQGVRGSPSGPENSLCCRQLPVEMRLWIGSLSKVSEAMLKRSSRALLPVESRDSNLRGIELTTYVQTQMHHTDPIVIAIVAQTVFC